MKKATKKELIEMANQMEDKYFKLVWFARKTEEDYLIPEIQKPMREVMDLYQDEVNELNGEFGDWYHGFNSGCLAAFRLILSMATENKEFAIEEFPFLDT